MATALVLCPSRDSAIPFYDKAADYVGGEVRKTDRRADKQLETNETNKKL